MGPGLRVTLVLVILTECQTHGTPQNEIFNLPQKLRKTEKVETTKGSLSESGTHSNGQLILPPPMTPETPARVHTRQSTLYKFLLHEHPTRHSHREHLQHEEPIAHEQIHFHSNGTINGLIREMKHDENRHLQERDLPKKLSRHRGNEISTVSNYAELMSWKGGDLGKMKVCRQKTYLPETLFHVHSCAACYHYIRNVPRMFGNPSRKWRTKTKFWSSPTGQVHEVMVLVNPDLNDTQTVRKFIQFNFHLRTFITFTQISKINHPNILYNLIMDRNPEEVNKPEIKCCLYKLSKIIFSLTKTSQMEILVRKWCPEKALEL